jgi:hypothetical protein
MHLAVGEKDGRELVVLTVNGRERKRLDQFLDQHDEGLSSGWPRRGLLRSDLGQTISLVVKFAAAGGCDKQLIKKLSDPLIKRQSMALRITVNGGRGLRLGPLKIGSTSRTMLTLSPPTS